MYCNHSKALVNLEKQYGGFMELIYDPKDAEGLTKAIKANINTVEQLIESLLSGCNHLISVVNGKELSGAADTACKGLFEEIILPMVKKGEDALEDLKSDLSLKLNIFIKKR